jgi:hypothetical protein
MLRTVPEVGKVSAILIQALGNALPGAFAAPETTPSSATPPHSLAA